MIHWFCDQHATKIALTLILVSLYSITLATRIKNGIAFIFKSRRCKIENIKKKNDLKRLTPCLCEEGIIYTVNMTITNLTLPSFPVCTFDDYTTSFTRREKYKRRFENLVIALNVTGNKQKKALLLN